MHMEYRNTSSNSNWLAAEQATEQSQKCILDTGFKTTRRVQAAL
jgi:hypothetical protein